MEVFDVVSVLMILLSFARELRLGTAQSRFQEDVYYHWTEPHNLKAFHSFATLLIGSKDIRYRALPTV